MGFIGRPTRRELQADNAVLRAKLDKLEKRVQELVAQAARIKSDADACAYGYSATLAMIIQAQGGTEIRFPYVYDALKGRSVEGRITDGFVTIRLDEEKKHAEQQD